MENRLLAKVEDIEIRESQVMDFLNEIGPQMAMQFRSPEGMKKVVEELVKQEVLYLDAKAKKMDEEEGFLRELDRFKANLLKQYAVDKIIADIEVSEEEVREFYEEHKQFFKKPESANADHILVNDEEEANRIYQELINDEISFADAALKYSSCPSKEVGGNLGDFGRGSMVAEFEEAVFSMDEGELSKPVKTQFGYHIIKLNDRKAESITPYEEIKDQIKQQSLASKQQKAYIKATDELSKNYKIEYKL